jgi:hypothetical protein
MDRPLPDRGRGQLQDRPSRPHRCPARTSAVVEKKILLLRGEVRRGAIFLAGELGLVASTVRRVLARRQVPYLSGIDPVTEDRYLRK